jgi:hypothetical protein
MGKATEVRHARPCAGHPRLCSIAARKTWMAGTKPRHDEREDSAFAQISDSIFKEQFDQNRHCERSNP